jgi:8-oxo-dGTP pyrophosphatase MutT (NUDIX family)
MPWTWKQDGARFCTYRQDEHGGPPVGEPLRCFDTKDEALRQLSALYASEPSARTAAAEPQPKAAGVALHSLDTGRVLFIQRALLDGEAAGGLWEIPGGKLDPGETPWDAAQREFAEETGHPLPAGSEPQATWLSPDGVYQGFLVCCGGEEACPMDQTDPGSRRVRNPDNPEGQNYTESMAWMDPAHLDRGPRLLRPEMRTGTPWAMLKNPPKGSQMTAAPTADELMASLVASLAQPAAALLKEEPLPGPTPWTIQDDGTADGHLALWASCHIGYPGCVKPPVEESFDFYNLGDAVTADGRHVGVGKVTVGCGHAGPDLSWRTAAAHYDESGTAVAVAHAVADKWGIRLPAVLVADATGAQIDEARRSPLSGDWRRINNRLRLVASLGVNVPGYPIPRALVAAGEVQSMFLGFDPADAALVVAEADSLAASIGLDFETRARMLFEEVVR